MEYDASLCRPLYNIYRFNSSSPFKLKPGHAGTFLLVQWLRYHTPNAEGLGSIPGQGTRSHMPQLRICMPQPKTLHVTTKTWYSQINKYVYKKKKWIHWLPPHQAPLLCPGDLQLAACSSWNVRLTLGWHADFTGRARTLRSNSVLSLRSWTPKPRAEGLCGECEVQSEYFK